jgi:lipooligosaccharide transport system ATP-binding protein
MIACRSPLSAGELLVDKYNVQSDERKIRAILGIVPQENNLDPDLNVLENLLVYSRYFRIPKQEAIERSEQLLDFIRLKEKRTSKVESLSGGMKRRLIIARSLLHKPKILLLDEPTTGLDPNVRQEIWEKLEELRRIDKITIVLSTHYMDEAEKLCQRLIVLADGKIVAEGIPRELINERVKKYALEIREANSLALQPQNNGILAINRGFIHLYFAETPDHLTPLMKYYGTRPMLLRPSNLEDVFLLLLDKQIQ